MYKSHLENEQTETESCLFCTEWFSSFRGTRWERNACMQRVCVCEMNWVIVQTDCQAAGGAQERTRQRSSCGPGPGSAPSSRSSSLGLVAAVKVGRPQSRFLFFSFRLFFHQEIVLKVFGECPSLTSP